MKLNLSEAQLQEAVRRLAHFAPLTTPELLLSPGDLVVETALFYATPAEPFRVATLQHTIAREFSLSFEEDEIVASLGRLGATGKVHHQPDQGTWIATRTFVNNGVARLQERQAGEEEVYREWLEHIDRVFPGCPATEKSQLCEDLKQFVAKVFLRHGAECIMLIQGTTVELDEFITNLGRTLPDILPKRSPQINSVMLQEFPAFFAKAPAHRKRYLAELLDSAFALHMLNVDSIQSELIQQSLAGITLYLDTNFIYRIYGLNGHGLRTSARRLVSLSKEFGAQLAVSRRTIQELNASLAKSDRALRASARLPRDLAAVGAEHAQREDFVTAFWRQYGNTGIAVDDFIELYRHPEELLRAEGIEVLDDDLNDSAIASMVRAEVNILNGVTGGQKPPEVAEHDVLHRILVRHLRDGRGTTYVDTKYWFLTGDSSLPRYDRVARRQQAVLHEAPFCIQPNQWLQLIRPLRPRAKDYDETFIDLLTSPYLRPYQALPADLAFKILARISLYKDHSPELAAKALTNTYLTYRLKKAQTEEEETALIDNAASQAAEEFRAEKDQLKKILEIKDCEIQQVALEGRAALETLKETEIEKQNLAEQLTTLRGKIDSLENSLSLERRRRNRIITCFKWLSAIAVWAVGATALWFILGSTGVPASNIHRILASTLGLGTVLVGLGIPLGFGRSWKIISVIGIILGILSAILNITR